MKAEASPGAALTRYREKRNFVLTPEPEGGGPDARADGLSFVVQKHAARHLHYDFRLELDGTLKSWAIPKGPSLDPAVKRMAVQVEDHPLGYASFEGTIPPGQYGAGTVIVWDKGQWTPHGDPAEGLRTGKLEFDLHGQKLTGRWTLVRMHGSRRERQPTWLLIKGRDGVARDETQYSVVEAEPESVMRRPRREPVPGAAAATPAGPGRAAPRAALPATLAPQLATRVTSPPAGDGWTYELKFDGYRLLARCAGGEVRLVTRNGHDWTPKLRGLARQVQGLGLDHTWLDGEIVALDEHGVPNFQRLQNAFEAGSRATGAAVVYYVFDIPFDGGRDLRALPLSERRERLRARLADKVRPDRGTVRFSEDFAIDPRQLLATACRLRMEGLMGKRLDAPYVAGRSTSWIKLKCSERQEFVIGGYTDPRGSRAGLGSLLLGVHDERGRLRYTGRVGSGLDDAGLRRLAAQLKTLHSDAPHFATLPTAAQTGAHWVRPELVAEVSFAQWTRDGLVRQAVFHGLRDDKPARAIVREVPKQAEPSADTPASKGRRAPAQAPAAPPQHAVDSVSLPRTLRVTHPDRVIDRISGVTKLELVQYHAAAAKRLLPHLRGRPVALVRAPDGLDGPRFFQKHARELQIRGIKLLDPELDPGREALLEIDNAGALLAAVQMNVIELHTWNALARSIEKPDRMVFDIDPGEGVAWDRVKQAAALVRTLLQEMQLESLLKTSGGKGLHVVVPIAARWPWSTVRAVAQAVVLHLVATMPDRFVAKSGPKNRVGRIFVDYLRNGRGATTAAAWSVRARPGLGVSIPAGWEELDALRGGDHWTVRTAPERLRVADPWDRAIPAPQSLVAALKRLDVAPR